MPDRTEFRRDDEVVLQFPVVAVVDQVDTRINALAANALIVRNVRVPLLRAVANEVVGLRGQAAFADDPRVAVPTNEPLIAKLTSRPGSGAMPAVSVADNDVVPPKAPVADETNSCVKGR